MCLWAGRGEKDVGMSPAGGVNPLAGTRGLREVSAAGDGDGMGERWRPHVASGIETGAR